MSDDKKQKNVPPEDWIPHPTFDSSDYLDGDPPGYEQEEQSQLPDDEQADG